MKNIILGAVAVVVTIVGVSLAGKPAVNVTTPAPVVNVQVPSQKAPVVNVAAPVTQSFKEGADTTSTKLGAVVGPDFYGPYWNVNGVQNYYFRQTFNSASSTMCSFKVPGYTNDVSSSTLMYFSYRVLTNTNPNANIFDIGVSSTGSGTSSAALLSQSIGANSATTSYGYVPSTFAAAQVKTGSFVNLVVGTTTGTTNMGYTGTCQAWMIAI